MANGLNNRVFDMMDVFKKMSPKDLEMAKEVGRSPKKKAFLRDIILKLEKMLPAGD